jgi:hypothetical protein
MTGTAGPSGELTSRVSASGEFFGGDSDSARVVSDIADDCRYQGEVPQQRPPHVMIFSGKLSVGYL